MNFLGNIFGGLGIGQTIGSSLSQAQNKFNQDLQQAAIQHAFKLRTDPFRFDEQNGLLQFKWYSKNKNIYILELI
jgi:hypothetical protein